MRIKVTLTTIGRLEVLYHRDSTDRHGFLTGKERAALFTIITEAMVEGYPPVTKDFTGKDD